MIKEDIDEKKLLLLYDSQGIPPELIKEEAKLNRKIDVPDNFYSLVAELHEKQEQEHATKREEKLDLENVPETKIMYFQDYKKISSRQKL